MTRTASPLPRRVIVVVTLMAGLLTGCAGGPSTPALFILDNGTPSSHDTNPADDAPVLVVGSISLADYLDQDGLVYQTAPHRIALANDNRWASPLTKQLDDSLFKILTAHTPHIDIEKSRGKQRRYYQLQAHVDQFMGHYDGKAHIKGYWQLSDPAGNRLSRRGFRKTIPLKDDGYPALVDSLSRGWQEISRAIADDVRSHIQGEGASHRR